MLSHRTPTKPGELRKNEPNPMGLLAPIGKLVNHLTEDLVLRIQKSNEVRIGHPRSVVQAMAVLECDRPTIPFMKSRRRIAFPKAGTSLIRTRLQQGFAEGGMGADRHFAWLLRTECLLWVKSGHRGWLMECPLYPHQRT
jgi:hypothetical protein